ncbi:EAL domain-containing protein [Phytohabitans sp. ZYX-F-186]|uniref:EAL domain-containing protein n=1 Tax=Phytohabitans maris TaxID=3071409 RepID=A0ABU0ZLE6_9ACTN|nr:EAL domain-containing protein [Phytohabitans sp. ZYX-F-186]MDQ7907876.1 EAL domain-containing protein [Phytohabitans sp. ZYX-F-186]
MSGDLTLGVLTPFLGGWYFGGLLRGIARAAAVEGATLVAVQTQDAGTNQTEVEPADLGYPVAWRRVSGFVVIINAVYPSYLAAVQATGKPVVIVSHEMPELDCPVVVPDNGTGIREAVSHLAGHGHRRIAFAGYLGAKDVRQRYEAYRDALRGHGIEPDPALLFAIEDNQMSSGETAARVLVEAGMPATAVIAGTDANAIGLMHGMADAGYRMPEDLAVIGFDDVRAARYSLPRLTTVNHPVDAIGRTAAELLVRRIRGEAMPGGLRYVDTSLRVRESCGCHRDGAAEPPAFPPVSRLAADGRAHFREHTHLQGILSKQYVVSMDLLRAHEEDPRRLGWLGRTSARAGCLGLWADPVPDDPSLDLVGFYRRDRPTAGQPTADRPLVTPVSEFPPADLLDLARQDADAVTFVVPVKVDGSDWGLLAVVDAVETGTGTGREPMNHWAALLTVALDYQQVLATLREQEERLRVAAQYDHLTGLPNRALFLERLREAMRDDREFAVLFVDLDGFKVVNDSLGHAAGDALLIQVGNRISHSLRERDTAARFGGDEFLILLDGVADQYTPTQVAGRLHAALAPPFRLQGQEVVVTASIGITLGGGQYADAEDLVRDADIAMYWSKSQRKGSHALFDVAMRAKAVGRLRIETELRRAIERGELEVHYQPIVQLVGGRTRAFEALIRWRHPTRGLILPDQFLAVAEETGLAIPIGRWVIAESCRQLAAWQRTPGREDLRISVNVSNRQFWQGGLVDDVAEALRVSRLHPRNLAFEITEGVIMNNVGLARKMLEDLHSLGCELHIDDFGTGYSSLEALHRLPIDALKIDRSFVARLGIDAKSSALVHTIVLMGGNLGLQLIAESVETEEQRDHLLRLGCAYGQGHLFSEPVPAGEAERLIS